MNGAKNTPRFTGMFGALRGRSSPQGAKVTGLLVTFHPPAESNLATIVSTELFNTAAVGQPA